MLKEIGDRVEERVEVFSFSCSPLERFVLLVAMMLALIILSWVFVTQWTLAQASGQSLSLYITANQLWLITMMLTVTGAFLLGFVPLYIRFRDGSLLRVSREEIICQRPDVSSLCTRTKTTAVKAESITEVLHMRAWVLGSYQPVLIIKTGDFELRFVVSDARHIVEGRPANSGDPGREKHPLVRALSAFR